LNSAIGYISNTQTQLADTQLMLH